jgi:hypothetical protein
MAMHRFLQAIIYQNTQAAPESQECSADHTKWTDIYSLKASVYSTLSSSLIL